MRPVSKKRTHNKRKLTEVIENNYAIEKVKNERFFVRSGYVRNGYDFKDANMSGNYWSPHRTNKFNVELLVYYEAIGVSPSAARGAVAGYPLRCLAIE